MKDNPYYTIRSSFHETVTTTNKKTAHRVFKKICKEEGKEGWVVLTKTKVLDRF